jgi:hypothetical protein
MLTLWGKGGYGGSPNVEAGKIYQHTSPVSILPFVLTSPPSLPLLSGYGGGVGACPLSLSFSLPPSPSPSSPPHPPPSIFLCCINSDTCTTDADTPPPGPSLIPPANTRSRPKSTKPCDKRAECLHWKKKEKKCPPGACAVSQSP